MNIPALSIPSFGIELIVGGVLSTVAYYCLYIMLKLNERTLRHFLDSQSRRSYDNDMRREESLEKIVPVLVETLGRINDSIERVSRSLDKSSSLASNDEWFEERDYIPGYVGASELADEENTMLSVLRLDLGDG